MDQTRCEYCAAANAEGPLGNLSAGKDCLELKKYVSLLEHWFIPTFLSHIKQLNLTQP